MKKYTATDYDVVDRSSVTDSVTDYNLWPQFSDHSDGYDYSSLYAAIFPPDLSLSHSPVTPPTIGESASAGATRTIVADYNQNQSLDFAPFQDLIDRRDWCLAHLGITVKEAEALRQENINLQLANTELNRRLNLLQRSASLRNSLSLPSQYTAAPPPPAIVDSLREMRIAEKPTTSERRAWKDFTPAAAARGIENQDPLKSSRDLDRVKLPKSISVRSNGYVKASQAGDGHGPRSRSADRFKTADQMQKVYVHGERKEEQPLELQVYNQGMTKTELCNKWEETGTCPYGDNCQFAHGIEELRPVLRHPRYKTEVCRMVLSGDPCPYGHRCHFRHALTDEEKLMSRQITSRRLLQLTR